MENTFALFEFQIKWSLILISTMISTDLMTQDGAKLDNYKKRRLDFHWMYCLLIQIYNHHR